MTKTMTTTVHLCVPDDQARHLPKLRHAPEALPPGAPVPRQGDVIFLGQHSAWCVSLVVHDWEAPDRVRIEVWLEHVGTSRCERGRGTACTLQ